MAKAIKSKLQINPETGLAYYDISKLMKLNAVYSIVYSGRSDGKTSEGLEYILKRHVESGYRDQGAYLRRWDEDIKGEKGKTLFNGLMERDRISELTSGEYTHVVFKNRAVFLANYDEELDKLIPTGAPFMYVFSLSQWSHYKSTSFPNITTILFDEFLTNESYLIDEYIKFMNFISTIVRERGNVKIIMMANTVNKSSLYFKEMNLTQLVKDQAQGTIEQIKTKQGTSLAIEYGADTNKGSTVKKPSNKYFGFDNQKTAMITNGTWEIGDHPHLPIPYRYEEKNIRYFYHIIWDYDVLRCNIVKKDGCLFTHIIRDDIKYEDIYTIDEDTDETLIVSPAGKKHRVYCPVINPEPNWFTRLTSTRDKIGSLIAKMFLTEKVFYEDNEVGSIVLNYIKWC